MDGQTGGKMFTRATPYFDVRDKLSHEDGVVLIDRELRTVIHIKRAKRFDPMG